MSLTPEVRAQAVPARATADNPRPNADINGLVVAAERRFRGTDPDSGFPYLTAALSAEPASGAALGALIAEANRRGREGRDDAAAVVAAADESLRAALLACRTPADVERVVAISEELDEVAGRIAARSEAGDEEDLGERTTAFAAARVPKDEVGIRAAILARDRLFEDAVAAAGGDSAVDDRRVAEVAAKLDALRAALEVAAARGLAAEADREGSSLLRALGD